MLTIEDLAETVFLRGMVMQNAVPRCVPTIRGEFLPARTEKDLLLPPLKQQGFERKKRVRNGGRESEQSEFP